MGDGEVLTVQTATKGAGVDLVFMGDCFDAKDIAEGKYLDAVNEAIGYFFAVEPYKTYRDYFNVYTVFGLSPDSGVGDVNTIRESKFGSAYALGGITPDEQICFEYACKAPTVTEDRINRTLITLIENTADYGGITYMWGDGSVIACCPMSEDVYPYDFRGLVQHEPAATVSVSSVMSTSITMTLSRLVPVCAVRMLMSSMPTSHGVGMRTSP